ncbi:Hypothetical protein, putative [Bodo saltans]|uniref:Uncharacterized protein n=1 Tax=Bodo saltans TaxID=75058 RepID=B6DTF3_BODSA|nr:hypothetical protein [Bodo saltans]CUG88460.1 Hypothetical protein, putative [Bodo saltans]|eukprot:CUG88460.1 Hypothetical protein, putative [Bodo saltans]
MRSQLQPRPSAPGVPEDSHVVHDEIKQLASEAKRVLQNNFSRHGTNTNQILAGLQQFGPSAQSKSMMAKEEEAAQVALESGIYVLYRNEAPKSAEASRDFCSRVGPSHKCFCTHTLGEHGAPKKTRRGLESPACNSCGCKGFSYVPNEPEEVGDHWISRRPGFVPGQWSPACRCNHRANEHDPVSKKCRKCTGCFRFDGHFGCIVCDGHAQDHMTVFESAQDRVDSGKPVNDAYFPLSRRGEEEFRDLVFGAKAGGGGGGGNRITGPRAPLQIQSQPRTQPQSPPPASRAQPSAAFSDFTPPSTACALCNTPFRSMSSKFCSNCGAGRQ